MSEKLYPEQDPEELGEFYMRHLSAMTKEGLHEKADIAVQLAWRDRDLDRVTAERDGLAKVVEKWRVLDDEFEHGRQKWGGANPDAHDDAHSYQDWKSFILSKLRDSERCSPIDQSNCLLQIAVLAMAAVKSFDRKVGSK